MYIQIFVKVYLLIHKILSGNEILVSIKGSNSVSNLRKMTGNKPNLDLVNMNSYIKFGKILSICSQDIERKWNYDVNQVATNLLQISEK